MRSLLLPILAAGVLATSGSAYAQTDTTKTKIEEAPKPVFQRHSKFDVKLDAGIGFRNNCLAYAGVMGINEVEDTTTLPPTARPSYGLGARVLIGNDSKGLVGGVEKYISVSGRQIPVRLFIGGAFYNPDNPEEKIDVQTLGIAETSVKINYDFNFGVHLQKGRGLNVLVGKRFF